MHELLASPEATRYWKDVGADPHAPSPSLGEIATPPFFGLRFGDSSNFALGRGLTLAYLVAQALIPAEGSMEKAGATAYGSVAP